MDINSTLPHIYDAAISQKNWMTALDHIVGVVPAKGAMLFANNQTPFLYSVNTSNSLYLGMEVVIADYMKTYIKTEQKAVNHVLGSPLFAPVQDTDIWPDLERLRRREDYVEARRIVGIFRRLLFNLSDNPACGMGVIFQFDASIENIAPGHIDIAKKLVPHLAKALEINRFYSQLFEKYKAILSALDHVKIGVCVMSPSGHVVIANEEAQRIFDTRDGISMGHDDRLISSNEDLNNQIRFYLNANSETAHGRNDVRECVLAIPRRSGHEPLILEIAPLRDGDGEYERGFAGALVTIIDPDNSSNFSAEPLKELYSLTKVEAEIACNLAEGHTIKKIADMRCVTENTVKTQTKIVYYKTNVKNRSQLIRKIVSLSPPIT